MLHKQHLPQGTTSNVALLHQQLSKPKQMGTGHTQTAPQQNKVRKTSNSKHVNQTMMMLQHLDPTMVAAALKHLGGNGTTAQTTSSQYTKSKERKQPQAEEPTQSIKVKRNSNILTSNGGVASKAVSNQALFLEQSLNASHTAGILSQSQLKLGEKRRNLKSNNQYYSNAPTGGQHPQQQFQQQKRRISSTSGGGYGGFGDQQIFEQQNLLNTTGDERNHYNLHFHQHDDEDSKAGKQDYNNLQPSQYFMMPSSKLGIRVPSGLEDTEADYYPRENSNMSKIRKRSDYHRVYDTSDKNLLLEDYTHNAPDEDVRIPAFLGRVSLEAKDKGQFYMTQVFSQSNNQSNNKLIGSQNQLINTQTLVQNFVKQQASRASSKLKTTKKAVSALGKVSNKGLMGMSTQQRLAILAGVGGDSLAFNEQSQENIKRAVVNGANSTSAQKRVSVMNASTSNALASTLLLNQTGAINESSQSVGKEFFNSTAPINMSKLNRLGLTSGLEQPQVGVSDLLNSRLSQDHFPMKTSQTLKRLNSSGKESQTKKSVQQHYYTNNNNNPNSILLDKTTSLSPLKPNTTTGKKQYLIHSLLNSENQQQPSSSVGATKQFLNLTLQKLIQQQQQQHALNNQEQFKQKRLNKTLDHHEQHQQPRNDSRSKISNPKPAAYQQQSHKSKFASTMRMSDFNQTQQIEGRRSKNSTQNIEGNNGVFNRPQSKKRATVKHVKKNSGQYDQNEREMLKKMMNFYQDDFLPSNVKQNPAQQINEQSNPRLSLNIGTGVSSSNKIASSASKTKIQTSQSKHKSNSTLNQYLQNLQSSNQKQQPHETGAVMTSDIIQNAEDNAQEIHPYRQQQQKGQPDINQPSIHQIMNALLQRDFQNKTQPIPKTILEMGAQVVQQHQNYPNNIPPVVQNTAGTTNIVVASNTAPQRLPQKDQAIKAKKQDNPAEIYSNKPPQILENTALNQEISSSSSISVNANDCNIESIHSSSESDDDDSDGQRKLSKFILGKQIGQGAYAVVRVATNKRDNKKYAIKVYDKSKLTDINRQRSVRREIKLLQKMSHPNIVKIYEAFETEENVYLVMEYVGGGSLHSYLREKENRRLEEEEAKRIFKQIMTALQYCHKKSIAHRDIKLENILLDENNNVKLIDFGFSTCIPNDKKIKMFCGTPSYMAPEIVLKEDYAGPPADIWASAVLLYALMNGCFPYRGATDKELYRRIQRGTFVLHNQNVTDAFVDMLTKMLNVKADDRPSAETILADEWFKIDSNSVAKQREAQKNQAESIADQKRQFKEKILGKIPVEKTKNTICLNSSQEHLKNIIRSGSILNGNNANQVISGSGTVSNPPGIIQNNTANEFSDYGIQQQNVIKRLNQEAYQAYYNTSGANFGMTGSGTIQNPYYNNFFSNTNFVGNAQGGQTSSNGQGGYYPGCFNNNMQVKHSPSKNPTTQHQQQTLQQPAQTQFPFNQHQPSGTHLNATQQPATHLTPQVFGSPTGGGTGTFHCTGGLINNNFNIINNIIMNPSSQQPTSPTQQQAPEDSAAVIIEQKRVEEPQQSEESMDSSDDLDEEIVDSMQKLGFNRSQIISQVIQDKNPNSQIGQIYTQLKEGKLSKTSQQARGALSMYPIRKPHHKLLHALGKNHNYAIFPNFVPSIPEDTSSSQGGGGKRSSLEGTQKLILQYKNVYQDEIIGNNPNNNNDDYNIMMMMSSQKSPKNRLNQTQQYTLFNVNSSGLQTGIIGQKY